ncbi:adenine nucleotide alpha hydrolase [Vibrio sp. V39_P1S14PM300]|uniref:adenine nucleotide alpha hydrolase n=1 Tax=Vibrio sp. V39_P1S14PM300 TaxID=1938690 RepID=UPI0013728DDE|nr:adenine nucleotide alpha hydrolase [Vibrio sp. V39_P1S14PM300]NAX22641.1 ATPase [Vibrio sp. V39_P1S14PM300]
MTKNVIVSWSSGKDSALTLERLLEDPAYQVVGLYTTYVAEEVPFQATPLDVLVQQAALTGLPLLKIALPTVFPSNEVYQSTIVTALKQSGWAIDAVAFGDMFCNGIEQYRRSYIEPAGWECVFPLLGLDSRDLAQEILQRGIRTILVTIDGEALPTELCGRWYNHELLEQLPAGVDPCGENGEFHTLVTEAPCFSGQLQLTKLLVEQGPRFSYQRYTVRQLPKSKERV